MTVPLFASFGEDWFQVRIKLKLHFQPTLAVRGQV
jgi:hypothetical protein